MAVSWTFEPSAGERASLGELFRRLAVTTGDHLVDGEVRRFGRDGKGMRYLLVRAEGPVGSPAPGPQTKVIKLYVLVDSAISAPYETGVQDYAGAFSPLEVEDFDGDGLTDFAYCGVVGEEEQRDLTASAVGYRADSWYVIERPATSLPPCPAYEP